MGDAAPQLCIVDPSLRDFVGHHYAWDAAVATAAEAAGLPTVTLAHRAVTDDVARRLRVQPTFRRDTWARHPLPARLPRPWQTTLPARAIDAILCGKDFAADLRAGVAALHLPPGAIVLGHMITHKHLAGFAELLATLPPARRPGMLLLLRYQPSLYTNPFAARALRRLERLAAAGHSLRLATDSARLAAGLGRLTTLPIEVLPIPHAAPATPSQPRATTTTRFVSLGNARDEKGFVEILDATAMLHRDGGLAGMEFTLQANDPNPGARAAIDRFAATAPPSVKLLHAPLAPAAYQAMLTSADVVLLPYWRSIYAARTSGVFLEAISAGKPVIATADTWMSDELALHGAGLLVPDRDTTALAAAIRQAARDRSMLAEAAMAARSAVLSRHSAAALVAQIRAGWG